MAAKRSYPTSEVRGSGREGQAVTAQEWLRGFTLHPRSVVARRSCPTYVYAPTSNAEETEVEWFYENLQDLLELTPKKDVLFIIGEWNAK